mgnify:CR=1 FL=1
MEVKIKRNEVSIDMAERKQPYIIEEQPGEKYWCACGESKKQPYCDGSHEKLKPGKTPIRVVIETARKVAWCGCGQSSNKPFCDGSHKNL